ncbi:uncharacterized protein LOC122257058 isoform X2 [Penaeus japonicus]|uniref:uncharacterized protein LOC122257058 isoform X2 n=1 Tax=Penaeus japonicus TaxID=27405 RepID=UPI001C70B281|nr:uncharacterized protein LOC122257058 isoform X2 [Penaeus japonicus]
MSSTSPEPPPGVQPGGPAGDQTGGPQTLALSPQKTPQSQYSIEGETARGAETCGRLDPRPPVPGGEDIPGQHHFHHREWAKESLEDWGKPGQCLSPEAPLPIHSPCPGEGGGDGPALAGGSVEGGSPCFGGGEGGSTPPVIRWSYSLPQLLEDSQGVQLFQEFLKEECGSCESLHFWFACNGLRKSTQDPSQLVTIIWKRFIRNFVVRVSEKTYKIVNDRINARSIDRNIFDDAQREVEEEIARSTYPSFLKSERYLLYLDAASQQAGGAGTDSPHTPSPGSPGNGGSGAGTGGVLPTLHEDCEFEGTAATGHIRLTQGALAATVKQRAAAERRRPEAFAGQYLHGSSGCVGGGVNPYHAVYASAHVSSRLDSELQSLSSDALTDDTISCTDSSVDGMSVGFGRNINPKYLKRQYHKMRENARQNRELALSAATGGSFPSGAGGGGGGILHGGVPFVPRTHRLRHESVPNLKPPEFAALLIERLEKVKRDRESQEKVQQSFKKIQEGDNVSDECRRQHAFNSLPPSLLLDKLNQKIPLDDVDPCQSILDEHVSRVWQDSNNDTPARSPGSPRPKSPSGRRPGAQPRPMPLSSKGMVSGTHPSMYVSGSSYLPSVQLGHQGHLPPGHPAHLPPGHPALLPPGHPLHLPPGHPAHLPPGHMPHPYQASKNWHHTRRRDRGQDVNSTFSSDSGNVADYYESNERGALHPLPKSRSMPEYMENYAGTSSDGGSSGRRQSSGRRSSSRRPPADLTDSGVSVVSDSGPSLAPSASSTERRSGSSGGRRSVSGGSVGGSGTLANTGSNVSASGSLSGGSVGGGRSGSLDRGPAGWVTAGMEQGGHMGHSMHAPHMSHSHAVHGSHASHSEEKRRNRGGGSSRSGGHSSSHGWGHPESGSSRNQGHGDGSGSVCPGSNGSTLRKQRPSRHSQPTPPGMYEGSGVSGGSSSTGSGGGACGGGCAGAGGSASTAGGGLGGGGGGSGSVVGAATESTTVIYNFHDDDVPFVTRIPTRPVTLRRFKQHLPKKGNYRFFFKKQCKEFGVIQEELTDDQIILPLFDGKIFAQIRKAD